MLSLPVEDNFISLVRDVTSDSNSPSEVVSMSRSLSRAIFSTLLRLSHVLAIICISWSGLVCIARPRSRGCNTDRVSTNTCAFDEYTSGRLST